MIKISKEVYNKLINNSITAKENKYHNVKTKVDGITDSNLEANWIAANVFYNVITK